MTKTRILVYGDSNTWGDWALHRGRYATHEQWPNIFQKKLGNAYEVIQEGLCGRIAGDHDSLDLHRNGRRGYEIALRSASPFDYLVVALGTNDVKDKYDLTAEQIMEDLRWYQQATEEYDRADLDMESRFKGVIFVNIANYDAEKFDAGNHDIARRLRNRVTKEFGNTVDLPDLEHSEDGLHYSRKDHEKVAQKVYEKLKEIER